MPTLHIRGVPKELHKRLRQLAARNQRSLSEQVILLLERAIQEQRVRAEQARVLARIHRRRAATPRASPDSVQLLRADRRR